MKIAGFAIAKTANQISLYGRLCKLPPVSAELQLGIGSIGRA